MEEEEEDVDVQEKMNGAVTSSQPVRTYLCTSVLPSSLLVTS